MADANPAHQHGGGIFFVCQYPVVVLSAGQYTGWDLEEHLIGIPASSMMALIPTMYSVSNPLVGGFVYTKKSLDFIEFFQPTTDRGFSYDQGMAIAKAVNLQCTPGQLYTL